MEVASGRLPGAGPGVSSLSRSGTRLDFAKETVVPMAWASEEDPLWSKPCLAYNVHAELDVACRDDLVRVQQGLRLPGFVGAALPAGFAPRKRGHDAVGEGGLRNIERCHLGELWQTMV